MERVVRKFTSFRESDQADRDYYLNLTPQQRIDILLELIARYRESHPDASEGFKRVYRIVELRRR